MMARKPTTVLIAGAVAGVIGAIPSTVHFFVTSRDVSAPLNALAAMVEADELPVLPRAVIASIVHFTVSLFWASLLVARLPKDHELFYALVAGLIIALLDLEILAPLFFPEVASLAFLPQLADHLAWAGTVGWVVRTRRRSMRTRL